MKAPRWDLSHLYASMDDPKIEADIARMQKLAEHFEATFKGNLNTKLGDALAEFKELITLQSQLYAYGSLLFSTNTKDADVIKLRSQLMEAVSTADAHITFFNVELGELDGTALALQETHAEVQHHQPMIQQVREAAKHNLSSDVERALTLRAPFGSGEWSSMMSELESELTFTWDGKELSFTEILNEYVTELDPNKRAEIQVIVNQGLKDQKHTYFMAKTLNNVMGAHAIENKERGYEEPISSRNLVNRVSKKSVDALHNAGRGLGAKECKRFYRILKEILELDTLRWSDRNALVPFADSRKISWEECMKTVDKAYSSFSPTLAKLVQQIADERQIDADVYDGKRGGAFDYTFLTTGGAVSYNFINYQGSANDVATVAHELGHGVHGLLAIEAQGALQYDFPLNYAETASIFGEMVTFNHLLDDCETDDQKLALLISKSQDFLNSVVRQLSFSLFEIKCHDLRKNGKLSIEDFNKVWIDTTVELYGDDGDVFNFDGFKDMDAMWCYVTHFCRPFYVYAYAFGELFTQSLFAKQADLGDKFEPLYLDLLRSAGTKDAVEMMAPFGLNPEDDTFWEDGIRVSLSKWLDEIEVLMAKRKQAA